jgi:hypothetical protein
MLRAAERRCRVQATRQKGTGPCLVALFMNAPVPIQFKLSTEEFIDSHIEFLPRLRR